MFTKKEAYEALQDYIDNAEFVDEKTRFPFLITSIESRYNIAKILDNAEASPLVELFEERYEELKDAPKDQILMELVLFMNEDQRKELLQNKKFEDLHPRIRDVEEKDLSLMSDYRNTISKPRRFGK